MHVSVVIVTLNRPSFLRTCLEHLTAQTVPPAEILVVDGSTDDKSQRVVEQFSGVGFMRNVHGFGRMTASRNLALQCVKSEVIAFLDDDAFAEPRWLEQLILTYREHPTIGAVGGRALNMQTNEEHEGLDRIGKLTHSGLLEGWFAADPGRTIEVDHVMGCNMSFRRTVLAQLGGFREDYPGISGVREDTDMCLRIRCAGYMILFNPKAVVTHIGAPQVKGRRFDSRYAYYASRNHMTMLIRNYGVASGIVRRYSANICKDSFKEFTRRIGGAVLRLAANTFGTCSGVFSGIALLMRNGKGPARHDPDSEKIRQHLSDQATKPENDLVEA